MAGLLIPFAVTLSHRFLNLSPNGLEKKLLNFIAGMRPSSPALSPQHLLGKAQAYRTMGNQEEAQEWIMEALKKAKTEHERNPHDPQAKKDLETIRNELSIFLSGPQNPCAAADAGGQSHAPISQNQLLPINGNDAVTHRPLSAQRAQDAAQALSSGIQPSFLKRRSSAELTLDEPAALALMPAQTLQIASSLQEKSKQVNYLFEKALLTLQSLALSNKTSLFLVYAHGNQAYGKADADTSKYLIEKLSQIRVNLYSDQTPMGQAHSMASEALSEDGKLEDVLTSQLCLLPTRLRADVEPVDKVVVCCSEVLEKYLKEWPHYDNFCRQLQAAYRQDCEKKSTLAIREVVRTFSQDQEYKAGFHHVLTEIAFLEIRAEELKDKHGIIPVSLTPKSSKECLGHFISQTTVRMEDIPRFEAQAQAGQEVYPNQSRHWVLFKLIERLLVSSHIAQIFLNQFWQGYSECISRLKSGPSALGWFEFVELVDGIFNNIDKMLRDQLVLTVQQQQLKKLKLKKEPLAILGENIEEEYFKAWEEESGEIQEGLTMYVAPHAMSITDRSITFNLEEAVTAFLAQRNDSGRKTQVLLLRGEAGSGKSTFNRQLARRLWQEYGAASTSDALPIPLYISLSTVKEPNENLMVQYLMKNHGFSLKQIEALRKSQRFILILDGYDEIAPEQRNLYADEQLDKWDAKIIVSSRPEYLTEGYQNTLQPRGYSRSPLEYQLVPFSEQEVDTYIEQYVKHTKDMHIQWKAQDYKDALKRIPNVKELLGTPFLLKMALKVLPTLGDATFSLTRVKLYEQFVQSWFERSLARLDAIHSKFTGEEKKAFNRLKKAGFIKHSQVFNMNFALAMYKKRTTVAEYSDIADSGELQNKQYEAFLNNEDEKINLLRFSALLICQHRQYRFIHKSIQDYLVARAVWEELARFGQSNEFDVLKEIKEVQPLWEALGHPTQVNVSALFNTFNLVADPAVQSFLVARVQQENALIKPLLSWIKASTTKDEVKIAAANAITILVKAGIQLNRLDLSKIKVPGANLSNGVFDQAQFEEADLSNVKLRGAWLRGVNLENAKFNGVDFGEWPSLELDSAVSDCCYSSNGHWLAVGTLGGIKLYQTKTLELEPMFEGNNDSVLSMAFSPNNQLLASGSKDGIIKLWKIGERDVPHMLKGHSAAVLSVSFSPSNGEVLASGSVDGTVKVWNVKSGDVLHTFVGHSRRVNSVNFSPNGECLVSAGSDDTVRLWDIKSGKALCRLEGHHESVSSVSFSPDGKILASGGKDKTVKLWNVENREELHTLKGHSGWVNSVYFSKDGRVLASGSADKTVKIWSVENGKELHTFEGHNGWVSSVRFLKGERISGSESDVLASGSHDNTVRLWKVEHGETLHTLTEHDGCVSSANLSPDGRLLVAGGEDGTVKLWRVENGMAQAFHTLKKHTAKVLTLDFSPKSEFLASGSEDTKVMLWDVESGKLLSEFEGHSEAVLSVSFSPSSELLTSGSKDGTVKIWDINSKKNLYSFEGHYNEIKSVSFSQDGKSLAAGSRSGEIQIWNVDGWENRYLFDEYSAGVENAEVKIVRFSPDSKLLASGSDDKAVKFWEVNGEKKNHIFEGHRDEISSLNFSTDNLWLVSGSWDGTVKAWSINEKKCITTHAGFAGWIGSIFWQEPFENNNRVVAGGRGSAVHIWQINEKNTTDVKLYWTSSQNELIMAGISGKPQGLDKMNERLLLQRQKIPLRKKSWQLGATEE